ncbi:tryptophanase [Paratrimastix pyriformis]|uniref:Tryptophanase n=1 Tax=Paratrimastix pyriformis TaxID=342808 RepID=A0ABQ8UYJ3_9EUKA|nr:tryptophanase [Paratrimastix pyriformis]
MSIQDFKPAEQLGTPIPSQYTLVTRNTFFATEEERRRVQQDTEYNCFAFPSSMLVCDYLSDSGTSAMTDVQWAALMRGDEAYGRNHGYYCMLDSVRQTFEQGDNAKYLVNRVLLNTDVNWILENQQIEGGFVNGGRFQLERPNFFITPQGRGAELLLYSTLHQILLADKPKEWMHSHYVIPSNGFFDTTEAHCHTAGFVPLNMFAAHFHDAFPIADIGKRNPFKGDINVAELEKAIAKYGPERIPFVLMTVTNNTAAGQPVSMQNLIDVHALCHRHGIPVCFDSARFAENAYFIKTYEAGFAERSIQSIVQQMYTLCDVFTMSAKKDGLVNIGGWLCFRDKGLFWQRYSRPGRDVGVALKEKQILSFGNDSYGGLSGRDIMALSVGLSQVVQLAYLHRRVMQSQSMAQRLAQNGVPIVLPPGAHAIYIDTGKFFEGLPMTIGDFGGVGLVIEAIRLYAIRLCELGAFGFEYDQKDDEARKGILDLVRIAIPRNLYNEEHIAYTVAAITELYHNRHLIPKVRITRGAELHLRHFQSGLAPIYPEGHPLHNAPTPKPTSH